MFFAVRITRSDAFKRNLTRHAAASTLSFSSAELRERPSFRPSLTDKRMLAYLPC